MPYETGWRYAPYLMYITLAGTVTEEEITGMVTDAVALLDAEFSLNPVNTLVNLGELERLPGINVLQREFTRLDHVGGRENGINIVYGMKPFSRYIIELLLRLTPMRFKTFDTRDDAELFAWQLVEVQIQADEATAKAAEAAEKKALAAAREAEAAEAAEAAETEESEETKESESE